MEYLQEVSLTSGADISIINGDLFQRVATIACLKKRAFKKADRIPVIYDQKRQEIARNCYPINDYQ